ncbi:MAG TPA: hypothetical protein DCF89_06700, partial [Flavobacteriales bacterium]|nr:hypothetical protein [Flavobacteriales bacterium]
YGQDRSGYTRVFKRDKTLQAKNKKSKVKSPIYHSIETYRFTMKRLYGNRFENRYENLIKYIPPLKSITELCPGDG